MRKLFGSALALFGILALAAPALAHSDLVSQTPMANSTVEAGPIRINLSFDEAPLNLPYGQGNLIAIADAKTGEQLGPACAKIEASSLSTIANISIPGEYKILWRIASEDGHVNQGDFTINVVNNSNYSTEKQGNQCFDEFGNELDINDQELLSKKREPNSGLLEGFFWGLGFILAGSAMGAFFVKRKQKN
jgi:methionine-rich copper-binding protein CopC